MNSFKLHCIYNLIIVCVVACCLWQPWRLYQADPAGSETSLHELGLRLNKANLHLRAVPQRDDGMWLGAIYLTETEQNAADIRRLIIQPSDIEKWQGTVLVVQDPNLDLYTSDWGEMGLRWGPLVFFGDQAILGRISKVLEN